jgi:hypothetical protein
LSRCGRQKHFVIACRVFRQLDQAATDRDAVRYALNHTFAFHRAIRTCQAHSEPRYFDISHHLLAAYRAVSLLLMFELDPIAAN